MIYRQLGQTSLNVSALGLGCGGMFATLCNWSPREMERLIRTAHDLGINFLDTADAYGSEEVVGRAIRPIRSSVIVATKGGHFYTPRKSPIKRILYTFGLRPKARKRSGPGNRPKADYSPQYIRQAVYGSLRRLGVGTIDLYQLHSPPAIPDDTREVLDRLKSDGLIRHWGASCYRPEEAISLQCETLQLRVNVGNFDVTGPILKQIQAGKIGRQPFTQVNTDHATALRFAVNHVDTVIFGTSSQKHLKANVTAIE